MHLQQRSVRDHAKIQNPPRDGDSTSSVHCLVSSPSSPTRTSNDELYIGSEFSTLIQECVFQEP